MPVNDTPLAEPQFPAETDLLSCLIQDRHVLRQRLRGLRRRARRGEPFERGLQAIWSKIRASSAIVASRQALAPVAIAYPPELPVSERRSEIAALIDAHPVLVLCGATGSGKSTQLPKICLELGRGHHGRIGHTQRALPHRGRQGRMSASETSPSTTSLTG